MALPLLVSVPACSPVRSYQEAARSLRFTLDRVDPTVQLAFPLDQSRIGFDLTVGVENPSTVPFNIRGFEGAFSLDTDGTPRPLGQVSLPRPLDLPAQGRARLEVALTFSYRDLAERWPVLEEVLHGERPGAWELTGTLRTEVHGIPVRLPVRIRRAIGAGP
ncbi:MAG: LEA type 2 family protein [Holophaga sp.]